MILFMWLVGCGQYPVPEGPEPDFEVGEEYISAERVAQAMKEGAAFYFLDARPPPDYELEHICGAISTPFYDIEEEYPNLPEDVWYIAYCSCPHSESGIVAEYLREQGREKVAVLDEGFLYWAEQGYPTESGP